MINLFTRSKNNPILKPDPTHDWEDLKVYNPGAIYEDGVYHLFYRARGRVKGEGWLSNIGHATSTDGEHFQRSANPIFEIESEKEKEGLEDPRIAKINDEYFMTYAAYDGKVPRLNIATSKNLENWVKRGETFSDFRFIESGGRFARWHDGNPREIAESRYTDDQTKSGAIFPQKINGKYWMLFNEHRIWIAYSGNGLNWEYIKEPFMAPREGNYFDNLFVEAGPPPIETNRGWFVIYHGIDKKITYRLGFLLLDLKDPTKIIFRSEKPIFEPHPSEDFKGVVLKNLLDILPGGYEKMEQMNESELKAFVEKMTSEHKMPQVVFCNGAVVTDGILRIYYGAGDSVICTATAQLSDILNLAP